MFFTRTKIIYVIGMMHVDHMGFSSKEMVFMTRFNDGKTILLTTHYIEEAEHLCETIAIINNGHIIATDTPQKLTQSHGKSGLEITISSKINSFTLGSWNHSINGNKIQVDTSQPERDMAKIISQIVSEGATIENVHIFRSSLEDVFIKLTGKSLQRFINISITQVRHQFS